MGFSCFSSIVSVSFSSARLLLVRFGLVGCFRLEPQNRLDLAQTNLTYLISARFGLAQAEFTRFGSAKDSLTCLGSTKTSFISYAHFNSVQTIVNWLFLAWLVSARLKPAS